jgi:eukaryotic-like serine/threonine-protein kinase
VKLGKYELVRKLATGGAAEVYLAKTEWLSGVEKSVVVKRILPHLAGDQSFIDMFLTEAKLAAHLSHPNIAQIFDFGQADGAYYLVMEYVDGPSLRTLETHYKQTPIPFRVCAKLVSYACEALSYAHDLVDPATGVPLELIHRDISPENILLGQNGAVKVVDFGIAKAVIQNHHTKTGFIKGKLEYMSPEQLRAQPLDRRADVFALGVVLYELVGGAKTHNAKNSVTLIHDLLFEPPVPVRQRRPDVPADLESIIERAIARECNDRYPDCRAMFDDLERFIMKSGEEPVGVFEISKLVAALPANPVGQTKTPPRKNTVTTVERRVDALRTPSPGSQPNKEETPSWPSMDGGGHTEIDVEPQLPSQKRQKLQHAASAGAPASLPPRLETPGAAGWSDLPGPSPSDRTELVAADRPAGPVKRTPPARRLAPVSSPASTRTTPTPPRRKLLLGGATGGILLLGIMTWVAVRCEGTPPRTDLRPPGASPSGKSQEVRQPPRQDELHGPPGAVAGPVETPAPLPTPPQRPSPPAKKAVYAKAVGALACATRPNDAEVYVDGRLVGRTPISKSEPLQLPAGKHTVTFKLNGKQVDQEIEVKPNELVILSGIQM